MMWSKKPPKKWLSDYMREYVGLVAKRDHAKTPMEYNEYQKQINKIQAEVEKKYGNDEGVRQRVRSTN